MQLSLSMTRVLGTACGNRQKIALRTVRPCSYSLMIFLGHLVSHTPHPVHFSGSTYRGCCLTLTLKLPGAPSTAITSESVSTSMFRCRPTSTILGEIIHMEQSPVGKVLSSITMVPPMV